MDSGYGVWDAIGQVWLTRGVSLEAANRFRSEHVRQANYSEAALRWVSVEPYDPGKIIARCMHCDWEVSEATAAEEVITCCPNCGNKGLPVDPEKDVTVQINWGELKILSVWAEQWARQGDESSPMEGYNCVRTVHSICRRLQRQHPGMIPLTLAGEIRQLQEAGLVVETNFDARENFPPDFCRPDGAEGESEDSGE